MLTSQRDHIRERSPGGLLWLLVGGFTVLMLASLVWGLFDPFFFGSDGRTAQGIDFFSAPKAFLNLLEGRSMYDSWEGDSYGPYSTWYVMHPAFAVFFASYLSLFSPWTSYWVFTFIALGMLLWCGHLMASLTEDPFEKRMSYAFFLCSFVTYWLLYSGNMHSFTVLSLTLILAGMYELSYRSEEVAAPRAVWKTTAGLLLSLLSKPVVLLAVPVLLINRGTRTRTLQCLGLYLVVTLVFLFVPALNPESIGLGKMIEAVMNPGFVRENLNIYSNGLALNEYMKDNIVHWLNIVAQSGAYWNHIDIFSLSALVNSGFGRVVPGIVYQVPVMVILLLSVALLFIRDERERLRASLLVIVASSFSYFLSYNTVWEYQYSSLFPSFAVLFLMYRRGYLHKRVALGILALGVLFYLPSPYVLVRGPQISIADINWIRSTKVVPSLVDFVLLAGVIARQVWVWLPAPVGRGTYLPGRGRTLMVPQAAVTRSSGGPRWIFPASCALGLVVLVAAYSDSFQNSFHFDDSHVVQNNLYIRNLSNVPLFFRDATTFSSLPANSTYRPLVTTSLAVDYWLGGGLNVTQFHISQLAMLVLLGAMEFLLFLRLLDMADAHWWNRYVALLAALLCCVHTTNTETVNLMHARSELLSAMGVVGSFLVYLYLPRSRRAHVYLLPMIIGALAKSPAVIFAPLFLVYLVLFEQRLSVPDLFSAGSRRNLLTAIRKSLPALIVGAVVFLAVNVMDAPTVNYAGGGRFDYLLTQSFVWLHYGRLFFLPVGLTADTDWTLISKWYDTRVIAGLLFVTFLLHALWRTSKTPSFRPVAFGIAWFGLALLPASSVIPLAEVSNEHRVFFPYIGLTLAVVWALALWAHRSFETQPRLRPAIGPAAAAVALLFVGGNAVGTYERNKVWRSEETLWRDVTEKSPGNGRGLMNYGLTQMAQGKYEDAKRLFDRAAVYTPNYSSLEINLGIVTDRLGQPEVAEAHFTKALQLRPDDPDSHSFYARWLVQRGRPLDAIPHLRRAIDLSPADVSARYQLLSVYATAGRTIELKALATETLALLPGDPQVTRYLDDRSAVGVPPQPPAVPGADSAEDLLNASMRLYSAGDFQGSIDASRKALALKPDFAEAQNNLAASFASLKKWDEAIHAAREALRLKPDFPLARNNLAWAEQEKQKANPGSK